MKKWIDLLMRMLVLSLMTIVWISSTTHAEELHKDFLTTSQPITSVASIKDQLFWLTGGRICVWEAGLEAPKPLDGNYTGDLSIFGSASEIDPQKVPLYALLNRQDGLYGLDSYYGLLYPIDIADNTVTVDEGIALDWDGIEGQQGLPTLHGAAWKGDVLYLLLGGKDLQMGTRELYAFDLQTGARKLVIAGATLKSLSNYKGNTLLIATFDRLQYEALETEASQPALQVLDLATGTLAEPLAHLPGSGVAGLAYDVQNDVIYTASDSGLYAKQGAEPVDRIAPFPVTVFQSTSTGCLLGQDRYVLRDDFGVYIRGTAASAMPEVMLNVAGESMLRGAGYKRFVESHPRVAVQFDNQALSMEAVYQDILTGHGSDIFRFADGSMIGELAAKGYCLELSSSPVLVEAAAKMYPDVAQGLYANGKLVAVPVEMHELGVIAYSPSVLAEIGLQATDLPGTLEELMDFMVRWVEDISQRHPDLKLFDTLYYNDARKTVLNSILSQYAAATPQGKRPFTLDTPLLRGLLQKLDEVTPVIEALNDQASGPEAKSMFVSQYDVTMSGRQEAGDYTVLPIALDKQHAPAYTAVLAVMTINPQTPHPETAVAYLECMLQAIPPRLRVRLYPDENEPIETESYRAQMPELQAQKAEIEKKLNSDISDEAKMALQDELYSIQGLEQSMNIPHYRYVVTPDRIAEYRKMAESISVNPWVCLLTESQNMASLFEQYSQQAITADTYIAEANRILQMMQMEEQ